MECIEYKSITAKHTKLCSDLRLIITGPYLDMIRKKHFFKPQVKNQHIIIIQKKSSFGHCIFE